MNNHYTWRIILVDADESSYLRVRDMLGEAYQDHFLLEWACSYQAGLEALDENEYDALLVVENLRIANNSAARAGADPAGRETADAPSAVADASSATSAAAREASAVTADAQARLDAPSASADARDASAVTADAQARQDAPSASADVSFATAVFGETTANAAVESGADWIRAARQRTNAPVVWISAAEQPQAHWEALRAGAADFLTLAELTPALLRKTIRFVIERQQVQAALRQATAEQQRARARLVAILQQMPSGVVLAEAPSGKLLMGNAQVDAIWGAPFFPAENISGYNAYAGSHADGRPLQAEEWPLARAVQHGETVHDEEINYRRGDGSLGTMLVSAAPISEDGQIVAAVAIFNDISERKAAAQDLQDNQNRLVMTAEAAQMGMWVWDLASNEMHWDDEVRRQFGFGAHMPLIFTNFLDSLHPDDREATRARLSRAIQQQAVFEDEYRVVWPDGSQHWIYARGRAAYDAAGLGTRMLGITLDVTRRKQYEEEARVNQSRIEVQQRLMGQREQERTQIARDLHDGPLQELIGLSFALHGLSADALDPNAAETLRESSAALLQTIDELRNFASTLRPPVLANFGLEPAIRGHVQEFQSKNPQLRMEFFAEDPPDTLPEATRLALYRIYQEALYNVVRHAHANAVNIYLRSDSGGVELTIHDDGCGFTPPPDWLELARNKHFGLVGARERAAAVGGALTIQSVPGQGTTVRVHVPVPAEQEAD